MRGLLTLALICLLFSPSPVQAFLQKKTEDKSLIVQNYEKAFKKENWSGALFYLEKLLLLEPDSETLLKDKADVYSLSGDISCSIDGYEKLVALYPDSMYNFTLANLYMLNEEFEKAEILLRPLYDNNSDNSQVVQAFLNSLLSQKKIRQAYWLVKTHHLEDTIEGYGVLGEMAIEDKDYELAASNFEKALKLDSKNLSIKNKLDLCYRTLKNNNSLSRVIDVASTDDSIYSGENARGLEIDRVIFYDLLSANPNYVPTKTGLTRSYMGGSNDFALLQELEKIPQDDSTKLLKAQTYYDMNMWSDAKQAIKGVNTDEAKELRYRIRRDDALIFTPSYSFFFQQLAEQFDLDIHHFGVRVSKNTEGNKNIFMEYNVIDYTGNNVNLTNIVHEFKGGVRARPTEKWEYRSDIGAKIFEFDRNAMIITDSWVKHYFSDKFNLKLGFRRDNIEQSYLSAVGRYVNGVFMGRAADNKLYIEFNGSLPHKFYTFGFCSCGVITEQNLPTNQYSEGLIGLGHLLYNNPKNKWINTFGADIISYNSAYQRNLLKIPLGNGAVVGGYFSPSYFNATTLNLRAEGKIKKWNLRYGLDGFGGVQTAMSQDMTVPAWGVASYLAYDINDNICINLAYDHYVYADIQRDQFIVNAVIRGFDRHSLK